MSVSWGDAVGSEVTEPSEKTRLARGAHRFAQGRALRCCTLPSTWHSVQRSSLPLVALTAGIVRSGPWTLGDLDDRLSAQARTEAARAVARGLVE